MTETPETPPARPSVSRSSRLALILACAALIVSAAQWVVAPGAREVERARSEDQARTQRRLNSLEDRIQRESEERGRLAERIGTGAADEDSLAGRVTRLEGAMTLMPGTANARFLWRIEQAEYFLRLASAEEALAGNSRSALTALQLADEQLREASDPRLAGVRRLLAGEISALRALPRVDSEGIMLKLSAISSALPGLPRRQTAPVQFSPAAAPPPAEVRGLERAIQVLKATFMTIVSVRRADAPSATLLTAEAADLLSQSIELELQMARLALLRTDTRAFRASIGTARSMLGKYFDIGSPEGASAYAALEELAAVPMPESLPDISASLTELLRVKEREGRS